MKVTGKVDLPGSQSESIKEQSKGWPDDEEGKSKPKASLVEEILESSSR